MDWDKEVEVCGVGRKMLVTIGDILSTLMMDLTSDELEEFAGELIKFSELNFNLLEWRTMNWKRIQQAWEADDRQMAVRLLESMMYEMRLRQRSLADFGLGRTPRPREQSP
jgi:hypothetical protein